MKSSVVIFGALLAFTTSSLAASNESSGEISYHTVMPVDPSGATIEKFDLANKAYQPLVLSNLVAGVLLTHLIDNAYPNLSYEKDYLTGSLMGQLLQENLESTNYDGGDLINPENIRYQLLAKGQGGPYQLNDYSKRLPSIDKSTGSVGLINYQVLQGSLGYTIAAQDSGKQTDSTGPEALDSTYFGPLAAAYFHLNDLNRLKIINKDAWGPEANSWPKCQIAMRDGTFTGLDLVLNAAYNAGTYAEMLKNIIDVCAYPEELSAYVPKLDDYGLNDDHYVNALQLPKILTDGYKPVSLPAWYKSSTFILYPRQIRYYVDQLYHNNDNLKKYGLNANTSFYFSAAELKAVFIKNMNTLGIKQGKIYNRIDNKAAAAAFAKAMKALSVSNNDVFNLAQANQRKVAFKVIGKALGNLEGAFNFSFTDTTEISHQFSSKK